jgi:hypothetical protein
LIATAPLVALMAPPPMDVLLFDVLSNTRFDPLGGRIPPLALYTLSTVLITLPVVAPVPTYRLLPVPAEPPVK